MIRASCEVLSNRRTGVYHSLTLVAPDIAQVARPGQFIQIGVPEDRNFMLRRPFSIHQASKRGGWAGTLEIVFDVVGPGTEWLARAKQHDWLDVIGPLGRPFQQRDELSRCVLVGGGYGAAPLYFLADELRLAGKEAHLLVGARNHERVFKPIEGKRAGTSFSITTEDGSLGESGRVTDPLPDLLDGAGADVVYACGPNAMLRAVAEIALARSLPCQVAVEEMMACGLGVCWTCVVPYLAADGRTWWNLRACTEGPVFNGARVWWQHWLGPGVDQTEPPPAEIADERAAQADEAELADDDRDQAALDLDEDAPAHAGRGRR